MSGLQVELEKMCKTSHDGTRWRLLNALGTFATLQWPTIEAHIAKRKTFQPTKLVVGKCKAPRASPIQTSKAKLSANMSERPRHGASLTP